MGTHQGAIGPARYSTVWPPRPCKLPPCQLTSSPTTSSSYLSKPHSPIPQFGVRFGSAFRNRVAAAPTAKAAIRWCRVPTRAARQVS